MKSELQRRSGIVISGGCFGRHGGKRICISPRCRFPCKLFSLSIPGPLCLHPVQTFHRPEFPRQSLRNSHTYSPSTHHIPLPEKPPHPITSSPSPSSSSPSLSSSPSTSSPSSPSSSTRNPLAANSASIPATSSSACARIRSSS